MAVVGDKLVGCVKWFNNHLNYGFITVLSQGEYANTDIFVHQTKIVTTRDCYRTLYTGECVQFEIIKSDNTEHPIQANNVTGYNGTLLHCENPNYRRSTQYRRQENTRNFDRQPRGDRNRDGNGRNNYNNGRNRGDGEYSTRETRETGEYAKRTANRT